MWPGLQGVDSLEVAGEVRSAHPAGDFVGTIRVNAAAGAYGKRGRAKLPEGSVVVQALASEPGQPPTVYYVMERRQAGFFSEGGDWEYAVVGSDGTYQARGKLKLCARCHAEAPRDHVFEPVRRP